MKPRGISGSVKFKVLMALAALTLLGIVAAFIYYLDNDGVPENDILSEARDGNVHDLHRVLDHGADANTKEGGTNWSVLHCAAQSGDKDKVKLLVAYGADVKAKDMSNQTPLHATAFSYSYSSQADIAEILVAAGADINAKDEWGYTPLHRAAEHGEKLLTQYLLDHGADINAKTSAGGTPLACAVEGRQSEVISLLKQRGAK
jgi:ankyrin repeat protein